MGNKIKMFKRKAYKRVETGSWVYEWYINERHPERSQMRIMAAGGLLDLRLNPEFNAFGYLLAAAQKGMNSQLESYARILFSVAALDTLDQELDNDLWAAIDKWQERRRAEGAKEAKNVSETQLEADTALMESVVEFAEADPKRRKEIQAEDKQILKEVLSEKGEGE